MTQLELYAEPRTVVGKQVKRLRAEGWVPAVLYGPNVESRPLQVKLGAAEEALKQAGTSQLISLAIAGADSPVQAIVRSLQRDAIHRNLLHLDLYQVEMTKTITVEVPLLLVGESPITEQKLGILLQGLQSVEVECLPGDLIDAIEVDLGELTEVDQQVVVGDLAIPSTVRILTDLNEMVVRMNPLAEAEEEEEEEVLEEGIEAEPELVGREEEEEGEE